MIDGWRPGRDKRGYPLNGKALRAFELARKVAQIPMDCRRADEDKGEGLAALDKAAVELLAEELALERVTPKEKLRADVVALKVLME